MGNFYSNAILFKHNSGFTGVLTILLFIVGFILPAKAQVKVWDRTFGGAGFELLGDVQQTSDGGYIVGGRSDSGAGEDKSETSTSSDFWILKLDAFGNKVWDKTYGTDMSDNFSAIRQTKDGGYILGGYTFAGISGDKSTESNGASDIWILKIDANGTIEWDRSFGGKFHDNLVALEQTPDGGYVLGGTYNYGIVGTPAEPDTLYWIIKLDETGQKEWDRKIGGDGENFLADLDLTSDGGYILGGTTESGISGDKTQPLVGQKDYWIVKLDAAGNILWDKGYGNPGHDDLNSVEQTSDGGFLLGGIRYNNIATDMQNIADYWAIKIDGSGNIEWDRILGGSGMESLNRVIQTADGNYLLAGNSNSPVSGHKTEASRGFSDVWLVKLNPTGNILWNKTIGGDNGEELMSLIQTKDNSYVLGTWSYSELSGDKTQNSRGSADYWIFKLADHELTKPGRDCYALTFEQDAHGIIKESVTEAGRVTITGKRRNSDGSYAPGNYAAIFDSGMPTGDDDDLHTMDWGNILIINQSLIGEPNDNQWGGDLILDFSEMGSVTLNSLQALDFDTYEDRSWVYLYDKSGAEIHKVQIQPLGDNSKQEVFLGNTLGVASIKVVLDGTEKFVGSGAIDNIQFCVEEQEQEDTQTISQVKAYPNPATDHATIEFRLGTDESYTINLYDLKGNLIQKISNGKGRAGQLITMTVDGHLLKAGLYVTQIITPSETKTIKVLLKK